MRRFNDKNGELEDGWMGFTRQQLQELKQIFNIFNPNENGKINGREIKEIMETLGFQHKNPILYHTFADPDYANQLLDFNSFLHCVSCKLAGLQQSRPPIMNLFHILDTDHTNTLNQQNIRDLAKFLGLNLTTSQLNSLMQPVSTRNNEMSPEDFYQVISPKVYH